MNTTFRNFSRRFPTLKSIAILLGLLALLMVACKKDRLETETNTPPPVGENYANTQDFFNRNRVPMQTFNFSSVTGTRYTNSQGTVVTITPNAFLKLNGDTVSGTAAIQLREIYKRSEMVLSDISAVRAGAYPFFLKSGGMFYIKAQINGATVKLVPGDSIMVDQPLSALPDPYDGDMTAHFGNDSTGFGISGWNPTGDALIISNNTSSYTFSLHSFRAPEDSGTWCNTDDRLYYYGVAQRHTIDTLRMTPSDAVSSFGTNVFLVFDSANSVVHVPYVASTNSFVYDFVPVGFTCTVVAVGVKEGNLYSSFSHLNFQANQVITFTLTRTTTDDFKAQLRALD